MPAFPHTAGVTSNAGPLPSLSAFTPRGRDAGWAGGSPQPPHPPPPPPRRSRGGVEPSAPGRRAPGMAEGRPFDPSRPRHSPRVPPVPQESFPPSQPRMRGAPEPPPSPPPPPPPPCAGALRPAAAGEGSCQRLCRCRRSVPPAALRWRAVARRRRRPPLSLPPTRAVWRRGAPGPARRRTAWPGRSACDETRAAVRPGEGGGG